MTYANETPPLPSEYASAIAQKMQGREHMKIIMEPGRAIAANAGVLLTKVEFLKQNEDHLQSGWGLDIWWSSNNKNSMYIVDKIKVENIEEKNTKNDKGFAEMKHYISKYKLRLKI